MMNERAINDEAGRVSLKVLPVGSSHCVTATTTQPHPGCTRPTKQQTLQLPEPRRLPEQG